MKIFMPLWLYAAIFKAQRAPQRVHKGKLKRLDVLVDDFTYHRICKLQQAFLRNSCKCGLACLTRSEIVRIILDEALSYEGQEIKID